MGKSKRNRQAVNIEIISKRVYGEAKLKKPKELDGIKEIGSVNFGAGKCKCPVFATETHIYVKHRDFFSPFISLQKAKELGMLKTIKKKFIYNDNFGSVVLRNEAWIRFPRWLLNGRGIFPHYVLCVEMEKTLGFEQGDLCTGDWERMFEELVILTKPYKPKK